MTLAKDRLTRFSDRVENYVKYRPSYPDGLARFLAAQFELTPDSTVADVGSGTGKLSEVFLESGFQVTGVEPNLEMREAGEGLLSRWRTFASLEGAAERTGMENASVDLIVAGQAFHWFDQDACKAEFRRILKPEGGVALVWNERRESAPFLAKYEAFLHKNAKEYGKVAHRRIDDAVFERFFSPGGYAVFEDSYCQAFDFEGLLGRYLSSSYSYKEEDARFERAKASLKAVFDEFEVDGEIRFEYDTRAYYGRL